MGWWFANTTMAKSLANPMVKIAESPAVFINRVCNSIEAKKGALPLSRVQSSKFGSKSPSSKFPISVYEHAAFDLEGLSSNR
jgi:hypothetical protein